MKECINCLFDDSIAKLDENGVCEYCHIQEQLAKNANPGHWNKVLSDIKKAGSMRKYDVLVGISGGEDSSVLLYLAVKVWKLRVLAIHFDNRSNRPEADNNIAILTSKLGVNFIRYYVDQEEYNALTDAFLAAGVPDADIANDIAMAKLMDGTCKNYGIKYILNGHDYRREGSSPSAWSYMDAKYVKSVYKSYTGRELVNYPLYTFMDQISAGVKGIRQVRPYHYSDHNRGFILEELKRVGWQDYGGKHNENIYTAFVGNYLLPYKFKIDKRRTYLSAQIREGAISKSEAKEILKTSAKFNTDDLGERKTKVLFLMNTSEIQPRTNFERYNFKLWRPVIWVLMKMRIVAYTFYRKYCF